jgi:transaldolase
MKSNGYFRRVENETPTRFWINNPTLRQAREAIDAGAIGCTTNPSYVSKLFESPEDFAQVKRAVDMLLPHVEDNNELAAIVQRMMVARLSDVFMPLYEASEGKEGYVTIQGDPFEETDAQSIIDEGLENRRIGPNITVKIPVTTYGIEAISTLVKMDVPTMATEVMGLSQVISICEAYTQASQESGFSPPFHVTHITGILDDHFKRVVANDHLDISPEAMQWAGLSIAKREYALMRERNYPGIMIGGGARKLEDFTELVGGHLHVTINWKGTADILLEKDGPVVHRIDSFPEQHLIDELMEKLPDYRRAYLLDGMQSDEYYDYGGVELFRSSFMKGWNMLLDFIKEQRRMR